MIETPSILVVDDTPENIKYIGSILKNKYRIKFATNGSKGLRLAAQAPQPDLILLDITMPEMNGYEVCEQLKRDPITHAIPVVFLTARSEVEDEKRGLELGAVDYITKPISPPILLARVATHLKLKEATDFLQMQNEILEEKVQKRTEQLTVLQNATMVAMGSLAETRDNETGNHIRRTQNYIVVLAQSLQDNPRFADVLTMDYIQLLHRSAPLHDIGKVGVRDNILLKPGKLTAAEFEEMKKHTIYGRDTIANAENSIEDTETGAFLRLAKAIAFSHQERWDGDGYPQGLSGDDIPLSARLMAVADVYDALISRRVYKKAMPHSEAVKIISDGKGTHFDPDMVDAFLCISDQFESISQQFRDS